MDQYLLAEECYKNGFRDGVNSIVRCRECVYRWKSEEEKALDQNDENMLYCFKHSRHTPANYFCGDAAKV